MRWGVAWTFLPDLSLKKILGTKAKKDKQKPFSHALAKPEGLPQCEYNSTSLYKRIKGYYEHIEEYLWMISFQYFGRRCIHLQF